MNAEAPDATIATSLKDDEARRLFDQSFPVGPRKRHPGRAALLAVIVGVVLALVLPFAPFVPVSESGVTGAALVGLAVGWLLLGLLLGRATNRRQRWAIVAGAFFAAGGVLLLALGAPAHRALDWVWPPALLAIGVWMIRAIRRQRGLLPQVVLYPVSALLVLASVGGGIETVAAAADAQAHPAPGRLIDVGGHRLHLQCTGTGGPTVVFEAGGGDSSSGVGRVTSAVAHGTRICAYDRAGHGWSDVATPPPSGKQIAVDLHTVLQRGGVPGPYVLAGHSFGGLYVRTFAELYPDDVAGMVLVDSTAAKAMSRPPEGSADFMHRTVALLSTSARFGIIRLIAASMPTEPPAPDEDEDKARTTTGDNLASILDEYLDAGDSVREAANLTSLGDKPLVVLTAGVGHPASWFALQDRMTKLSRDSVHRTVRGVDHQGLVASEAGAAATARGILDVVTAVRTGRPLPPA
jgi:alpha-beta hydrolase superfamily lysophospholipase